MTEQLHGLPYWELRFDSSGDIDGAQRDALVSELPGTGVRDLFVFSHGWNSSPGTSRRLYDRFFGLLADAARDSTAPPARIGLVGILWPSLRWADEAIPDFPAVAAAGLADTLPPDEATFLELQQLFSTPTQQAALTRMEQLLREEPDDPERFVEFQQLMATLADDTGDDGGGTEEDSGELSLVTDPPDVAFGKFVPALAGGAGPAPGPADAGGAAGGLLDGLAPVVDEGGGAVGFNPVKRLWKGAKEALRQFTYFQMKKRAGVVGEKGLGPALGAVHSAAPALRVHLIGHSFGARLVSYTLAGLPQSSSSPVKSLLLLQGAFSHFAFAVKLPHRNGAGALAGHDRRVDGPLVVVHSSHDSAVGVLYPIASRGSGEDAAGLSQALYRWGAMGADGAQAVDAAEVGLRDNGQPYALASRRFTNVDASAVVRRGGPPAGAHSDIFHPELGWLALSAAGLAGH